ncbi:uncharacterized protein [Lolium perenne]|uniref:uncharacterized protein isoform X2 n=1 Tax=Lolium perenne TaxID=4522 RepID=UPI0021F5E957|nr:uncharacterized protein LOC127302346 isoform X3 [Lolium perenne]
MVDGAGGGGAWRAADASPPEIAGQRPGNGGVREHKTSWPGEGAAPPAPSSMRVAPSFRTPAALQATPPSAAEAPNSFVLRHLCAVPLESAICLPLEDEGKVDRAGLWLYQGLWDPLLVPVREGTCKSFADFEHVELVPGGAFGDDKGVRISYVAALSTLQDEIEKIKEATTLLKPRVAV